MNMKGLIDLNDLQLWKEQQKISKNSEYSNGFKNVARKKTINKTYYTLC